MMKWILSLCILFSACSLLENPEAELQELGFGKGYFADSTDFYSFTVVDTLEDIYFSPHMVFGGKYLVQSAPNRPILFTTIFTHPSDTGEITEQYSLFYENGDTLQISYYLLPKDSAFIGDWTVNIMVIDSLIYQKNFELK